MQADPKNSCDWFSYIRSRMDDNQLCASKLRSQFSAPTHVKARCGCQQRWKPQLKVSTAALMCSRRAGSQVTWASQKGRNNMQHCAREEYLGWKSQIQEPRREACSVWRLMCAYFLGRAWDGRCRRAPVPLQPGLPEDLRASQRRPSGKVSARVADTSIDYFL